MGRAALALAAAVSLALPGGATAGRWSSPYPASALAEETQRPDKALVVYLGQEDADPGVCDQGREGPSLPRVNALVVDALLDAVIQGRVGPEAGAACLAHLLTGEQGRAELVLREVVDRAPALLASPAGGEILQVLAARPPELAIPAHAVDRVVSSLERAEQRLHGHRVGLARQLRRDIELEAGRLDGVRVDRALLEGIEDHELLSTMSRRLPEAALRTAAGRRLAVLRAAGSPHARVRQELAWVQDTLEAEGALVVDPSAHPVLSASWVASGAAPAVIRLQQDPAAGVARLVAARDDRSELLDPVFDLRSGLRLTVAGLEEAPLGLCPGVDAWDPTPCVPVSAMQLEHVVMDLREDGTVALAEDLDLEARVAMGRDGELVRPRATVGGVAVQDLSFRFHLDPVAPVVLQGAGSGARGPDAHVDIYEASHGRLVVGVRTEGRELVALVARHDEGFSVVSRGAPGASGSTGTAGSRGTNGTNGMNGSCPSMSGTSGSPGGQGGRGGAGGNGGPGGDGGTVSVRLHCDPCEALKQIAVRRVRSEGGPGGAGGPGGPGGPGGSGGMGGSGTSCSTYDSVTKSYRYSSVSGGSSGAQGAQGPRGPNGQPGPPGADGPVLIRLAGQDAPTEAETLGDAVP